MSFETVRLKIPFQTLFSPKKDINLLHNKDGEWKSRAECLNSAWMCTNVGGAFRDVEINSRSCRDFVYTRCVCDHSAAVGRLPKILAVEVGRCEATQSASKTIRKNRSWNAGLIYEIKAGQICLRDAIQLPEVGKCQ